MKTIAVAAVLLVMAVVAYGITRAFAGGDGVLRIGSATAAVGDEITMQLEVRDVPEPGLGDWRVGVEYDRAVVTAIRCSAVGIGACNPDFDPEVAILTGVVADETLTGDHLLGSFTFRCMAEGSSPLALTLTVGTIAGVLPPIVTELPIENGSITCAEPTAVRVATVTPRAAALPSAGHGRNGAANDDAWTWPIFVAGAIGIALAGGALVVRRKR